MRCLLISTLAEYQTHFWLEVGKALRQRGFECEFISFDDRSTEILRTQGFVTYALDNVAAETSALSEQQQLEIMQRFGISIPEQWFLHERLAYGENDPATLQQKLSQSLLLADHAIRACSLKFPDAVMLQEVGGFLSVVACYQAATLRTLDHWFIEPAFFKGRVFFSPGGFHAPKITNISSTESLPQVLAYLKQASEKRTIVIPEKDKRHYSSALRKIINKHNMVRLIQKSYDKYILGKKQEFGYITRHVAVHMRMLLNSFHLRGHYTSHSSIQRFIYFPLHVPADMALTIRSPEYVDQLSLLEHILRATPSTHRLVIKEHPAMIGALPAKRIISMLKRYPQLHILHPSTNNYDVLRASELVITINSKSGAEALLLNKSVLVLGEAFYSDSPLVNRISSLTELRDTLARLLNTASMPLTEEIQQFFHAVWDASAEGELYSSHADAIAPFVQSLIDCVLLHPRQ